MKFTFWSSRDSRPESKASRFIRAVGARVGAAVKKLGSACTPSCFRPYRATTSPPSPCGSSSPRGSPSPWTATEEKTANIKGVSMFRCTPQPTPGAAVTHPHARAESPRSVKELICLDAFGPLRARAPINGGNTCYLDSILVAMFAAYDGWDGLVNTSCSSSCVNPSSLSPIPSPVVVKRLRDISNTLRTGNVVQPSVINGLRDCLIENAGWYPGHDQHDAAEFFSMLLDALHAPFVSMFKILAHGACPSLEGDYAAFTERMLWLNIPPSPPASSSSLDLPSRSVTNTCDRAIELEDLVDSYFFGDIVQGLQRDIVLSVECGDCNGTGVSVPTLVDATVSRSLVPGYTPVRETGEQSSPMASRESFEIVTVPFAVSRFDPSETSKDMRSVRVPTVLNASRYVGPFATTGCTYILLLRSVVCHLGDSIELGHYVTYTYAPQSGGWKRWDDMAEDFVQSVEGDVLSGEPKDEDWAMEIRQNCYLLFYELVPGERW